MDMNCVTLKCAAMNSTVRTLEIHYLRTVTKIPVNCDINPR